MKDHLMLYCHASLANGKKILTKKYSTPFLPKYFNVNFNSASNKMLEVH